jgi:hypothetical protein
MDVIGWRSSVAYIGMMAFKAGGRRMATWIVLNPA